MHSTTLLDLPKKAAKVVKSLYHTNNANKLPYHNLEHTQEVVEAARTIAKGCQLSPEELDIVTIAAWFHDVGHLSEPDSPIKGSITLVQSFLEKNNASSDVSEKIVGCINATDMPQKPSNLLEEVICDADMAHLAGEKYLLRADALRKENQAKTGQKIKRRDWDRENTTFFETHEYFTEFAQAHYGPGKLKNQLALKAKIATRKKKKAKTSSVPKSSEVMYRIVMRTHIDLSAIADTKANIMISVNAILLSLLVTVLFRRIEEYTSYWLPGVILTTVCLLTIVFAILATLPQVTHGRFRKEDVIKNRANLLFFGNFYNMTREDFEWGMKVTRQSEELAYGSLTRDLYNLGNVLARKYKMLRVSYLIFMIGLVVSIIAFVIASFGQVGNQY